MTGELPFLRLEGSPYDVGLAHGVEAREFIGENVLLYLRRFAQEGKIDRPEIRRRADGYRRVIEEQNPAYAEEVRGIAEGARQDVLDIVAVNVRYEILYTEFVRKALAQPAVGRPAVGGCTSFALLPSGTSNGHLLLGQNWDWIPNVRGIVVRARRAGHPEQLAFTEAGIAGAKIGVNSAGIALAINGLLTDRDSWSRLLKPFHVRCWEILASRTLVEAAQAAVGTKRACSANFLIGRAGGGDHSVVDLEAAPEVEHGLVPEKGFLAHTNHFLDPDTIGVVQPLGEDAPSTYQRLARINALVRARLDGGGRIGINELQAVLADHDGEPYSICRHASLVRPEHERYATVASAIIDVDAGELFLAGGTPCTVPYERYTLSA